MRATRNRTVIAGVYAITHIASTKRYIGSTRDLERRTFDHCYALMCGTHQNPYLQHALNAYGPDAFTFDVIEAGVNIEALLTREQHWIDTFRSATREFGFNIAPCTRGASGIPRSAEIRAKISASCRGNTRGIKNIAAYIATKMLPTEQVIRAKEYLASGRSARSVATTLKIPEHTISRIARAEQYADVRPELNASIRANRPEWRRGETNPHAKLCVEDVRAIKARIALREPDSSIANDFPVGAQMIALIRLHRAWESVPD